MTKRAAASRSRRRRFFVACALRARKPRKRRAEKEGRPKRKEPRRGARRRGREEVPGAHTQAGRPRGCRARHPPRGHVPNNSVGTRKQLLRNSYYRVTLRAHISRVRLRVAAGGAGGEGGSAVVAAFVQPAAILGTSSVSRGGKSQRGGPLGERR